MCCSFNATAAQTQIFVSNSADVSTVASQFIVAVFVCSWKNSLNVM